MKETINKSNIANMAMSVRTKQKVLTLIAIFAIFMVVATTTSCNGSTTYNHYEAIKESSWNSGDTLTFNIPPQQQGSYALTLGIRATQNYPYKQLVVIMQSTVFPSRLTRKDTIRCNIADDNGNMTGNNGISSTDYLFHISNENLHTGDSLSIKIHHCMKPDNLAGLTDMGIRLSRNQR